MRNTSPLAANSPFNAAAQILFPQGGRITGPSVRHLAGGTGLVLAYRREFDHAPPREEGWPLAGGLWGIGAASIPAVLPQVADVTRLDEGIHLAERIVAGHPARASVPATLTSEGLEQAFELLGVSNRQIRFYARENFLMVGGMGSNLDHCDLLAAALRSRAVADRVFFADGTPSQVGNQFHLDGALHAMLDGGEDAGLSYTDALINSRWILEQLDVFTGTVDMVQRRPTVSEEDVAEGMRTLSSQLSRQLPLDDIRLASDLAQQLNVAAGGASGSGSNRDSVSEELGRHSRSHSMTLGEDADDDRSSKRSRTTSNSSASDEWVAGSLPLMNFTTLRRLSSSGHYGAMRSDWLVDCKAKLNHPPIVRGASPSTASLSFLLGTAIRKKLVAPGATLDLLHAEASRQRDSGNFARVRVLRNEAVALLKRYLHARNTLRDAAGLAHLARAELVPLPYADCAGHEIGLVIKSASGATVVAYNPNAFQLCGLIDDESLKDAMRAMLKLLIAQRVSETCLDSARSGSARGLTVLSSRLVNLVGNLKFPPAPSLREAHDTTSARAAEKMSGLVIEALADALTCRVLGQTTDRPATPQHMGWKDIIARALEHLSYQPALYHGLLGQDGQARSAIFESIFKSAQTWLDEARPDLGDPSLEQYLARFVELANAGRIRKAPFDWGTVTERVIDNFWSFVRSPHLGDVTQQGNFTPLQDHPIGYIQSALIRSIAATRRADEAHSIINCSVLALLSRDAPATENVLRALVERAEKNPRVFATVFMCDIGDADDDAGRTAPPIFRQPARA